MCVPLEKKLVAYNSLCVGVLFVFVALAVNMFFSGCASERMADHKSLSSQPMSIAESRTEDRAGEYEVLRSTIAQLEERVSDMEAENRRLRESLTNALLVLDSMSHGPWSTSPAEDMDKGDRK